LHRRTITKPTIHFILYIEPFPDCKFFHVAFLIFFYVSELKEFCYISVLSKCTEERKNAMSNGRIGEFVPQCHGYSPMQYWGSTGYCWCVDQNGKELPGTKVPPGNEKPTCPAPPGMFAINQGKYFIKRISSIFYTA
jgi:hypothetical protein